MIDRSVLQVVPLCRRYNVICSLMHHVMQKFLLYFSVNLAKFARADEIIRMFPKYGARDQIDERGKPPLPFVTTHEPVRAGR